MNEELTRQKELNEKLLLAVKNKKGVSTGIVFSNDCISCGRKADTLVLIKDIRAASIYCDDCKKKYEDTEGFTLINLK